MSFSQTQLDALDSMIASGVLEADYDGQKIRYRSMDELLRARQRVADAINAAAGNRRPRHVNPTFDRGV